MRDSDEVHGGVFFEDAGGLAGFWIAFDVAAGGIGRGAGDAGDLEGARIHDRYVAVDATEKHRVGGG